MFRVSRTIRCGVASQFVELDHYLLGDVVHVVHVPDGIPIQATRRVIELVLDARRLGELPDAELPHGGSSGSIALSWACQHHQVIGLIGFDGFDQFAGQFRQLITYWTSCGKRLISLMERSAFDDVLERFTPSRHA